MTRRLWLSIAALAVGAGLLVAAGVASPASSGTLKAGSTGKAVAGGTLKINLQSDTDYVDPALAYYQISWQFEYSTCAKLLNYPDKPAPAGSQLVPDAATGMPTVSKDGKTYTFTVKPGQRFSNGAALTAANFAAAFNRDANPKMQSPAASFMSDIVGAQNVIDGKATKISGVVAKGMTLTITLTKPAGDFLARVAMPFFCAIPTNLPIDPKGVHSLPAAGPYYVASYTPNRQIVLKRNPYYKGSRPHNVDQIVYTVGVDQNASLLQIESGQADYAADGLPNSSYAGLVTKYGVNKGRLFVNPTVAFRYLALNTSQPLFKDNTSLRRAVNFAIDRPALLRQYGKLAGQRATHILPPGMPGYEKQNIYPLSGANYTKAKQLASGNTRSGQAVLYTCNAGACPGTAQIIQYNLGQIGVKVDIKQFARAVQFGKEGTRGEPFDIAYEGWIADYLDPFDFINILLDGNTIHATNNVNFAYFNDPKYNKEMEAAAQLTGPQRYAAYGQLDINISAHAAPLASWEYINQRDFVSSRVKNFIFSPAYGFDLGAASLS